MTFAKALRAERERIGITQSELAQALGPKVSAEAVSKWERGLSTPAPITQEGALARLRSIKSAKTKKPK